MNGSANDIESHIDLFLEHIKRSAARAMEERANDGWLTNENLVHSIIKRSRSGMSSSDDGTVQISDWSPRGDAHLSKVEVIMMELNDDDKAAGEILRSLLSTPKMENSQQVEVNNWRGLEGSYYSQEQIIWQLESPKVNKNLSTNNEDLSQHIPITYVTADTRNFTFTNSGTNMKPLTYVLSRNVVAETPKYCAIDDSESNIVLSEPTKIVFVQQMDSNSGETAAVFEDVETKILTVSSDAQTGPTHFVEANSEGILAVRPCDKVVKEADGGTKHKTGNPVHLRKKNTTDVSVGTQGKCKKIRDGEGPALAKTKMERKISGNKKSLNKWKNTKLKSKLKTGGKALGKKPIKTVKSLEFDKVEDRLESEKDKRNLFELTKLEDNVDQVIERFEIGCECSESNCFEGLNPDNVFKHRLNIADLTKGEHDMYLMGVIMASVQNLQETCRRKERIRIRSCYAYQGKKVCLTAFLYLQHVTLYQMKRLRNHLKNHGVSPRIHGNRGRKPANTFSLDIYRHATNFVQNYIEKHCVKTVPNFTTFSSNKIVSNSMLKERKCGKKTNVIKILNKMTSYHLPPDCTKKTVHREYKSFCENLKPSQKAMKYSTFTNFMKKQFPNVKFSKVDKKQEEKSSHESRDSGNRKSKGEKKTSEESLTDENIQTVVYIPAKGIQVAEPTTFFVAPKQSPQVHKRGQLVVSPAVRNPQIVFHGQQLQFCGGSDFQAGNQVLVGNQIYSAQCVDQTSGSSQQIYRVDNIV